MKTIILLALISITNLGSSQVIQTTLNYNNISAIISDGGSFFNDVANSQPGYEVPKNSGISAINEVRFLFGGIMNSGDTNLILGGASNLTSINSDLFNGAYSNNNSYANQSYQDEWSSSTWTYCQEEIDSFIAWWSCDNGISTPTECLTVDAPSSELIQKMISWRGNGNTQNGESYIMMPYFDNPNGPNGQDLQYLAEDGDYPLIKGCCSAYIVQNDHAGIKSYSNTGALGVEVHYQFYQYKTWDYLNDVTFVDVFVINRSSETINDFRYGVMVDASIGNNLDDYMGCDSLRNTMYFYNGDGFDEQINSSPTYEGFPPSLGIVSLSNGISSVLERPTSTSVSIEWNSLSGLLPNGQSLIDNNSNTTQFIYPSNPNDNLGWNEVNLNNSSGNRDGIMAVQHGQFNSGEIIKQTYAIVFAQGSNNLSSVNDLLTTVDQLQQFYDNEIDTVTCVQGVLSVQEKEKTKENYLLFPNPTSTNIKIQNKTNEELTITLSNIENKIMSPPLTSSLSLIKLDLSKNAPGVYLIEIESNKGKVVKKVIKE